MRISNVFTIKSLLVTLSLTSAYAAPPTFAARTELPFGNVVTTGDYNKNGFADIIAAVATNTGDYQVSVQLSNGKGTFSQGPTVDLGSSFTPVAIAAADFNGDGKLDFAVVGTAAFSNVSTLYIVIQHSSGFIITPIQLPEQIYSGANVAVGDLNGDKLPDIVIPTAAGTTFVLNAGNGKFKTPEFANTSPSNWVVLADVNQDKHLDILALSSSCCGSGLISVMLGDGHGGFYEPGNQPSGNFTKFTVADINGDGKLDLVSVSGSLVGVAPGKGDGTFGPVVPIQLPGTFYSAVAVAAADLNGDGSVDLAVVASSNQAESAVIVFPNTGKGSFNASTIYSIGASSNVIVARFTASPDALVVPPGPTLDGLLLNNGKGVFRDGALVSTSIPQQYLVSGDFNNDGRNDLVGVNNLGLTVYLNSGNTTILTPQTPLPFYTGPIVVGDFNGDGRLDLVDVNNTTAETLLGDGSGSFLLKPLSFSVGNIPATSITSVDINGDGKLDLVTNNATVILGNGDGTFQAANNDSSNSCYANFFYPGAVLIGDFNRDGKPDVLTLCNGQISVFLNTGAAAFGYPNFSSYFNATGVAVGDFNKDGIPDFAYSTNFYSPTSTATDVYIEFGNGDGTFSQGPAIQVPGSITQLVAADFNGDGHLDLAAMDSIDAAVIVLAGKGDGTFQNPVAFGTASDPTCLLAVPMHDPARPEFPDLVACVVPGIAIDFNTSR